MAARDKDTHSKNGPCTIDIRKMARESGLEIPLKSPFTANELNQMYPLLRAPIREDAIERTNGRETGKGYDTTSYRYQALVDRMNEVLGPGH